MRVLKTFPLHNARAIIVQEVSFKNLAVHTCDGLLKRTRGLDSLDSPTKKGSLREISPAQREFKSHPGAKSNLSFRLRSKPLANSFCMNHNGDIS